MNVTLRDIDIIWRQMSWTVTSRASTVIILVSMCLLQPSASCDLSFLMNPTARQSRRLRLFHDLRCSCTHRCYIWLTNTGFSLFF